MFKGMGQGTLGRDAELRYTANGAANLQWTMAFNTGWGENQKTTWVRCTLWGDRGEKLAQYLTKGTKITVIGTLELREFQKNDGTNGYSLEMRVDDFTFASSRNEESSEETEEEELVTAKPKGRAKSPPKDDDTIPF